VDLSQYEEGPSMVARAKVKPSKTPSRKSDVIDIKTEIAIAKYEQFVKDPSTRRKRDSKRVPR
jgi:hypothetical protein